MNETRIARSLISAQSGFNTRRHFDAAALESLAESIRQQGVIQPLLLRPRTDGEQGFWIVCGERRWRAAGIAGLDDMPAMVRPMTDREAFLAAMHENKEREDLTPAEEALSARRAVDACDGNEGEAAKVLGWTRDRLRARLLLVHALPEVLDAAAEKRIALGHAELLATLPETLQKTVFAKVLQHGISVDELKRQMAAFTQDLGAATFNTAGCNGCVNNSSTQSQLFEFKIGTGRCSNKTCWNEKVEAHIAETKATTILEVPLVFFDREKEPALYRPVTADGVGEAQYREGCQACGKFGAIISTRPGKEGAVTKSICFDLACNDQKLAAHKAASAEAEEAEPEAPAASSGKAAAKKTKKLAPKKGAAKKTPAPNVSPKAVTDLVDAFLQNTASEISADVPRMRLVVMVHALRELAGTSTGYRAARQLDAILKMSNEQLEAELVKLVGKVLQDHLGAGAAVRLLNDAKTALAGRFKLTKEFLNAHTKSGIEALLTSAGFAASLDGATPAERNKAFAKLMAGKHADIVSAVLKSKHDFSQFVPPSVDARVKALAKE
ncbi:MAG TPA: PRTRC system ParB family protein [Nevskia sp.]|nr:PRTRC system ParB family protein [Nevskia sp.]